MGQTLEPAASSRARCRGCGRKIEKGSLRFGERLPNPFGEGEMTLWFHPRCGALKRPEPFLELLETDVDFDDREHLAEQAREGLAHRRLPRIDGVQRAPSGRARCRNCRETIAKDAWRIPLVYYQEGRFEPSGFVHLGCSEAYFGTTVIEDRLAHFSPELTPSEREDIAAQLAGR